MAKKYPDGKVIHFAQERGARTAASKLSRRYQIPIYAVLQSDEDGHWHVGSKEILKKYSKYKIEIMVEHF